MVLRRKALSLSLTKALPKSGNIWQIKKQRLPVLLPGFKILERKKFDLSNRWTGDMQGITSMIDMCG